jgi:hypothetical protein
MDLNHQARLRRLYAQRQNATPSEFEIRYGSRYGHMPHLGEDEKADDKADEPVQEQINLPQIQVKVETEEQRIAPQIQVKVETEEQRIAREAREKQDEEEYKQFKAKRAIENMQNAEGNRQFKYIEERWEAEEKKFVTYYVPYVARHDDVYTIRRAYDRCSIIMNNASNEIRRLLDIYHRCAHVVASDGKIQKCGEIMDKINVRVAYLEDIVKYASGKHELYGGWLI